MLTTRTLKDFNDDNLQTGSSAEAAKEMPKSGAGELALNGGNFYLGGTEISGGTVVNNGTLAINNQPTRLPGVSSAAAVDNADGKKAIMTEALRDSPRAGLPPKSMTSEKSGFQQRLQTIVNRAAAQPPVDKSQNPAEQSQGTSDFSLKQAYVSLDRNGLDSPVVTPPGDGAHLTLTSTNAFSDGNVVGGGKFYTGVTKDDANGMRFLLGTNSVVALESADSSTNDFSLNFQNVPVETALNYLSDKAGFIVVQDARINDNVTIKGNHLTQAEAVNLLNAELNRNGYAAIREGQTLRIVNKNEAKTADIPVKNSPPPAPIPQPEFLTRENAFSTFSMNVSDVSFKLAAASLQNGRMPDAASIRSEEFINAFDYRDPEAAAGQPVAFASERAQYPFAQNRDLLRFSIKTAAAGRAADRPLNLVLVLDTSGSMERADRVAIIREAMRVLAAELHPQDTVSVVTFARTARLWADGVSGDKAGETLSQVGGITPEGGTNLEEAMNLAYQTALRHYLANGANRVVLLTDGAANLGNVNAAVLKAKVEAQRRQGIALDCFGIGWEDFNDDMLAELSGNGDGRYAFINTPEEAGTDFAAKLAGALQVAAQDVKVQVEFNPQRVTSWRQIGYAKHQLTKEQFRDNSVLAAEIAAQEAGNALYTVETKPDGIGPVATVYVRYKVPGTENVQEHSWEVPYAGNAPALEQASAAMRLAATASAFSEWLAGSPFAQEVSPDELLKDLSGVPQIYGADQRPQKLEWMIRQAKSLSGK